MCKHLLAANYKLNIFNRTKSKTDELLEKGAIFMQPEDIAKNSDIIFLMVGYPSDVEDVVFN